MSDADTQHKLSQRKGPVLFESRSFDQGEYLSGPRIKYGEKWTLSDGSVVDPDKPGPMDDDYNEGDDAKGA